MKNMALIKDHFASSFPYFVNNDTCNKPVFSKLFKKKKKKNPYIIDFSFMFMSRFFT